MTTTTSGARAVVDGAPAGLTIIMQEREGLLLALLIGPLDIFTVPGFWRALGPHDPSRRRRTGPPLVVDVTDTALIDSSGLGALVSLNNHSVRAGWRLGVVHGDRTRVRRLFRITGLGGAFALGADLDAVRALLQPAGGAVRPGEHHARSR